MSDVIYVVAHKGGVEGHDLPYLAFHALYEATAWCRSQAEIWTIAEVPVFPHLPKKLRYNVRAVAKHGEPD